MRSRCEQEFGGLSKVKKHRSASGGVKKLESEKSGRGEGLDRERRTGPLASFAGIDCVCVCLSVSSRRRYCGRSSQDKKRRIRHSELLRLESVRRYICNAFI